MKRGIRYLLVGTVGVLALAYGAAVGFLALNETSLVYASAGDTRSRRHLPPNDGSLDWDSLRVRADDGVPVFLLESRVDSAPRRPWAIYFHGNAGLLGSRGNIARYRLLREAGFNVLAVEYRGYGASLNAGSPSEAGIQADAKAAWDYLTRTLSIDARRIIVYGWSLGSGPAMYLAAAMRPGGVVTEGAFTSLPDVGAALYPWVPVRLVMRNRFDNIARARTLGVPWIVFHGRNDAEIPFAHARALAAAAPGASLVALDSGHDDGVIADRETTLGVLRGVSLGLAGSIRVTGRPRAAAK
jgi:pimeloyl-ACP methyl ester carboxylesterase